MAIKKIVTCDVCGVECGRWYEVSAYPTSFYDWQDISDMPPNETLILKKQLCKDCFERMFSRITDSCYNRYVDCMWGKD